jgi:hypothetical protein
MVEIHFQGISLNIIIIKVWNIGDTNKDGTPEVAINSSGGVFE